MCSLVAPEAATMFSRRCVAKLEFISKISIYKNITPVPSHTLILHAQTITNNEIPSAAASG